MKAKYLLLCLLMSLVCPVTFANPVVDNVAAGKVDLNNSASHLQIHQHTPQAIINWRSFNIAPSESVHFQQPTNGIALNRIDATRGASEIAGKLSATGNIILSNAAGIHIGSTAQIDVAGLIATTANISDRNFLAGNYHFEDNSGRNGSVSNAATINATEHGFVALMAPHVVNTGKITAHLGQIADYSTTKFTLSFGHNNLVHFAVDDHTMNKAIQSKTMQADHQGNVAVSASTAKDVLNNVIKMPAEGEANFAYAKGGKIILTAKAENNARPRAVSSSHSGSDSDYEMVSPVSDRKSPTRPASALSNHSDSEYVILPGMNTHVDLPALEAASRPASALSSHSDSDYVILPGLDAHADMSALEIPSRPVSALSDHDSDYVYLPEPNRHDAIPALEIVRPDSASSINSEAEYIMVPPLNTYGQLQTLELESPLSLSSSDSDTDFLRRPISPWSNYSDGGLLSNSEPEPEIAVPPSPRSDGSIADFFTLAVQDNFQQNLAIIPVLTENKVLYSATENAISAEPKKQKTSRVAIPGAKVNLPTLADYYAKLNNPVCQDQDGLCDTDRTENL
ncbi:MAG: filamentous hemagglutinin N-terminal domain-containing protein [Pseudomonadota bacterium]